MRPRVVIIGSGFGGAVAACRLAESGRYEVIVLERGRRWGRNQFPRRPDQMRDAVWEPETARFGVFDVHSFRKSRMDVLTGAGLGGGSLIYSNVLYPAPEVTFRGWPGGITRQGIEKYYQRVLEMMEARPYPIDEPSWPYADTPRTRTLERAAALLAKAAHGKPPVVLERPPLAVQFGPRPDEERPNQQGVMQTTCRACGECNIGCNTQSKNTLDLNYLARAEKHGAELRTHAEVTSLERWRGAGYLVRYRDPTDPAADETVLHANYVVLAAGSLGSTHLLLRMKRDGHLPALSAHLGARWSSNGDLLGVVGPLESRVAPATGPAITAALRFAGGSYPDGYGHELYVEDGGYPPLLAGYLEFLVNHAGSTYQVGKSWLRLALGRIGVNHLTGEEVAEAFFPRAEELDHSLPLFGMGRERADARLRLAGDDLELDWKRDTSALHFDRLLEAMQRVAWALDGGFNDLTYFRRLMSVHPLGGCPMGDAAETGVVDARRGEAFGHPGLFVLDGSIIPSSVGPNPSLTIAAVAERFVEGILQS